LKWKRDSIPLSSHVFCGRRGLGLPQHVLSWGRGGFKIASPPLPNPPLQQKALEGRGK